MRTAELLSELRSKDIKVWAEGDRLRYDAPKGALTPDLREELVNRKPEILALFHQADTVTSSATLPLKPVSRDRPLALSFAQQRLWFLDQLEPDQSAFNLSWAVGLTGGLEVNALEQALSAIVERHEVLRTTFAAGEDGEPVQVIAPSGVVELEQVELRGLAPAERDAELQRQMGERANRPFDLATGPVLRTTLYRLAPEEHVLALTIQHIAFDGWSFGVLARELGAFYAAFVEGREPALPALPIQYADYAAWQRQWLQGEVLEAQLDYWRRRLGPELPVLELPTDRPRPAQQSFAGARESYALPAPLVAALRSLSQREGVTLFMALAAGLKVLFHRYSGQSVITIGTPVANRTRSELESLIGFFVNSLVLSTELSGELSFREALARVREVSLGAYAHQDLPFEQLVDAVRPQRDLSRHPLFQVVFALQNVPFEPMELPGLRLSALPVERSSSQFDLTLFAREGDGGLRLSVEYNTDLFDRETIHRLLGHYETLLAGAAADPEQAISRLPLLGESERRQLLVDFNATKTSYPQESTLAERFEAQVAATPGAVALVFEDQQLTYSQLNSRANHLAWYLRQQHGVVPEVCVGLCLERSVEMVVGLLGILKAGGAYLPLDPGTPAERLVFMLEDADIALVLTQDAFKGHLPGEWSRPVVALDSDWASIAQTPADNLTSGVTADNLAYIMYTSGSTGVPKGTSICQRSVLRLVTNTNYLDFGAAETLLLFAPLAFDASTLELWGSLLHGAQLVIFPPQQPSLEELGRCIQEQEISTLWLTAALFHQMVDSQPEALRGVRQLLTGGDVLSVPHVQRVVANLSEGGRLVNGYGPTENTTFTCCHVMTAESRVESTVPIGRPIANTQVYVLDQGMQPVPVGVYGELYIGGDGLARDYLRRPALTAEKFVPHPFSEVPGARLYRTGDVVRYRSDGTVEFQGRQDYQVKLRGYRIELGEIEAVLGQHPDVQACVAMVREDEPGDKRLVGYIVPAQESVAASALRRYLQERVPDYMVPAHFVMLDALPVTPNGKLDRRALPAPGGVRPELDAAYQAPRGPVEQSLAQIWKQILRIDQVGRQDNFFELGGDSILSIQIVAKANQAGLRVTPKHLFQYQTIAGLAGVVESHAPVTADQGIVTGPLPLSPVQHWFFAQQLETPDHWNMAWVLEARQPVDPEKMEPVVEALLRHHDALRLRFVHRHSGWTQELGSPEPGGPFSFVDLSHLPSAEAEAAYAQEADRLHATLDLAEGALIRVALFRFGENQADRVLLVIHHLAVDGISWRILLDDLQTAYDQLCTGKSIELPPKTTSFKDWAERLVEYARSDALKAEVAYWRTVADTPWTPLPRDFVDGVNTVASTRTVAVELDQKDTGALLQEIPEVYHTQINDVLLTALVDVLAQWTQQDTVSLNLEGHGREQLFEDIDLSRTVGWFTTIFPVVLERGPPVHPGELLKSVKEQLRQIPLRGIGYGLLRYLSDAAEIGERLGESPEPEVAFNYLGQFDQVIASEGRWSWSGVSRGTSRHPEGTQPDLVVINARVMDGVLQVNWSYSEAVHRRETIERLANDYLAALLAIIRHCQSPEAGGYTPSDFPLARVGQSDLDKALIGTKSGDGKAVLSDLYPLTPLQQGLWFHELLDPVSGTYFIQNVMRIEGCTNRDALCQAWEKVVEQHAILRTGIIWEGLEYPLQLVRSTVELPWAEMDWRESPDNEHQSRLLKFLDEDRLRGFDLTQAPLMRLTLIQVAETSAILVWSFHHLILDRWSVDLVQQDVWSAYQTLVQGQALQLNALRPYRDYLQWLQDQDLNRAEQYWRQLLSGFTAPTVLGVDQAPGSGVGDQESSYDSEKVSLSEAATSALSRWARQQQLTLNTVVQGAWAMLLSRYSGSEDVVFGATVSGRSAGLPGIEFMVGLFINTLPVRVHVPPSHSVAPWLTELQEQQVTLREYEYTPLYEIQKWSEVPAGEPLFNTLLVFENIPLESGGGLGAGAAGLNVQRVAGSRGGGTNYPLTVVVVPGRTLQVRFTYDTEHYTAEAITRMVGHFQHVLTGMIGGTGQQRLEAIPLLTEAECQQLLVDWNAPETTYPRDVCIHDLFEAQVKQTPDAVALVFGQDTLTYDELNTRANQLARHLISLGVGPETNVGLCVERSFEMVVGILGILKGGGAFVPLDPKYPHHRLVYMLDDAQISVLLTMEAVLEGFPEYTGHAVCLDKDWLDIASGSEGDLDKRIKPDNAAYVIYTSGSTGNPKGVLIAHASICNHMLWRQQTYPLKREDRFLHKASLSFDISVWEIFAPLLAGARLILALPGGQMDGAYLAQLVVDQRVTVIHFSPTALQQFLEEKAIENCSSLKRVFCGGEAMSADLKTKFFTCLNAELIHQYGPTETTVDVTTWECRPEDDHIVVPIGHPIANTQVYILDANLQPVPVGVQGELYIGGASLARGYLNRPELTAEKFVADPFSNEADSRLYKTGDLGRYRNDGSIEFLGRKDFQVKLRGFRIELGEVEATLCLHPSVGEAVVVAREDRPGDKRLVAYVVVAAAESAPSISLLRAYLQERLPDYMVPSAFVYLDRLPITPNGKVDRRALPAPDRNRSQPAEGFVAPRDELELQLAKIWEKVLGIKNIGVEDNFFDLGGHSLLAVRLFNRIQKRIGKHLTLATLFQAPTIGQLARIIRQEGFTTPWSSLVPIQGGGSKPPFFCLHGCFGEVAHFYDLARLLGPEQPFYGLRALGLEKGQVPQTRFEDMAAHYIKEIRTIQSDGPYFIGASGAGCFIALEIAHQLESQGQNVTLLALMIPSNVKPTNLKPNGSPKTFSKCFRRYIRLSKLYFSLLIIVARSRLVLPAIKHSFLNRVLWRFKICRRFIPGEIHRLHRFGDAFSKALKGYEPEAYQGRITCFLNDEYSHNDKRRHNNKRRIDDWYDLAVGGLDVRLVPGDTFTMWRKPHVQILADQLQVCLDEAQTDSKGFIDTKN